jgi:DUF177 domain-containing protein
MPGGASKLRDVRRLSDARAILDLEISLAQLPGVPVDPLSGGAPLRVRLQFGREQGFMVAEVEMRGELGLVCQRCMGPMKWRVDSKSHVLLIESEAQADGAPAEWETYLAAEGRVNLAELAAEELLLSLPIVPLHTDIECEDGTPTEAPKPEVEQETARPFADLRALLERSAKGKK